MADTPFSISAITHRALGKLIQLQFGPDFTLRLKPAEASSLSFAFVAVRDGVSPEREIYMSPLASDASFTGLVDEDGITILTPNGPLPLDWQQVTLLASTLAAAI